MVDTEHWIWLQQALGPASPKVAPLLEAFGGVRGIYDAARPEYGSVPGLTGRELDRLCDKSMAPAARIVEDCLRLGLRILTMDDPGYPERLRVIYAPPCVLYLRGDLRAAEDSVFIAMVGTRQVTEYGIEVATRLSMGLAACGATVVSGLALGVDTFSHRGALKGEGRTVAVIGNGPDIAYPPSNAELGRLIAANGAVVSEYPPGTPPLRHHFPARNRIIAGLSLGTVVVEAGAKSGSLITAGLAAEMGRDVFAVPGSILSPMSEGVNRLLRDGAKPVMNVADILEEYCEHYPQSINLNRPAPLRSGPPVPEEPEQTVLRGASPRRPPPQNLTRPQAAVFEVLTAEPVHVDQIALRANLEPRVVLGALTTLEIQGLTRSFPGRRFAAVSGSL